MVLTDDLGVTQFMPSLSGMFGGGYLITLIWLVILILLVGIVILVVYRHMQFKYRVILNEPRGRSLLRGVTEARKVKEKDGSTRWVLRSLGKKIAIPNLEIMNPSMEKRLRGGVIELLRIDEETFVAINVGYDILNQNVELRPLANSLNNIRQISEDLKRDYSGTNWFKDNAAMLVQLGGLMMIIAAMVFIVIMLQDSITASNAASGSAMEVIEKMTETFERMNECNVGGIS